MGYYTEMTDGFWEIPETAEVLQVLKDLNAPEHDHLKRGGSWTGGDRTGAWYSWIDPDYDTKVTSVNEVFTQLGFDTTIADGNVVLLGYDDKTGQEDVFLAATAPFVSAGSFLNWRGEDGHLYRYEARDGQMIELTAQVTWNEARWEAAS